MNDCRASLNTCQSYVLQKSYKRTAGFQLLCFYLSNEGVSLLENASHMGLPVPDKLKAVLSQLHNKEQDDKSDKDDLE